MALPSSVRRSSVIERLFRLNWAKYHERPWTTTPTPRMGSPSPGGSILTTSAPMSARSMLQKGPARILVRSTTRMPESGTVILLGRMVAILLGMRRGSSRGRRGRGPCLCEPPAEDIVVAQGGSADDGRASRGRDEWHPHAHRRARDGPARRPLSRLPGELVFLAPPARRAGRRRVPRGGAGHARVRPDGSPR